jgi:hypothetical protein
VLGWSPAVCVLLEGQLLRCGCLTGTYECHDGDIVVVVDAPGAQCHDERHAMNAIIWRSPAHVVSGLHPLRESSQGADAHGSTKA